jgi:hypothetical protein
MTSSNRRGVLVLAIVAATFHQGCLGGGNSTSGCDSQPFGETDFRSCPVPQEVGPHHETRADGRVDVTALQAWPDRAEELRLTPADVAEGCAAYAACGTTSSDPSLIGLDFQSCLQGRTQFFFSTETGERAIPIEGKNERLPFFLREVIAAKGDCAKIKAALTGAPSFLYCEEDGCIAREKHEVTCEDTVAVFDDGTRRDCARAEAECSAASETGCTDRRFSSCNAGAKDRCDGDVKLGCDGCGFVSFHDCSWNGGHCAESASGAACVPPDRGACEGMTTSCTGDGFDVCAFGEPVHVDCAAMGMKCSHRSFDVAADSNALDQCAYAGLTAPCMLANCVPQ